MTRVYVPGALDGLGEIVFVARMRQEQGDDDGFTMHAPVSAHAVTPALRTALPDLDEEGWEHYAMTEAAQESLETVTSDEGRDRRLVIVVEVGSVSPRPDELTAVEVGDVRFPRDVVAYMVDTDDAVADVARAARAIRLGEDDAGELAQRCLDHELGWYATTEVDEVLGLS